MWSLLPLLLCTFPLCCTSIDEATIAQHHMAAIQRYMQTREAAALASIRNGLQAAAQYPTLRSRIASDLVGSPAAPTPQLLSGCRISQGVVLLQTGQADEAARQLQDAVNSNPGLFMVRSRNHNLL